MFQGPPGQSGPVGGMGSHGPLGSQGPPGPLGSAGPRGFPVSGYFSPFSPFHTHIKLWDAALSKAYMPVILSCSVSLVRDHCFFLIREHQASLE